MCRLPYRYCCDFRIDLSSVRPSGVELILLKESVTDVLIPPARHHECHRFANDDTDESVSANPYPRRLGLAQAWRIITSRKYAVARSRSPCHGISMSVSHGVSPLEQITLQKIFLWTTLGFNNQPLQLQTKMNSLNSPY